MSDKDRIFAHKQTIVVLRHKLAEMHDVNDELRKQLAELKRWSVGSSSWRNENERKWDTKMT